MGFKGIRYVLDREIRLDDYESAVHVLSRTANMSYMNAAACMIVMKELGLIEETPEGVPYRLTLRRNKKAAPETSAAWRRIQNWRQ